MAAYTTADLLTDIRLRVLAPGDNSVFDNTDVLRLADAEMQTTVLPLLMSLRGEYCIVFEDQTVVAGQAGYDIPARAVGLMLREVHLVDAGGAITNLPQLSPEDIETTTPGPPEAFYLRQNQVYLYPTPATAAGTLRLYYPLRPASLIEATSAALVSSINTGTGVVTFTSVPSAWTTGNRFDWVRKDGGSEPRAIEQTASLISGTDVTFASLPSSLVAGDYLALAGETPLIQLPAELRPVLCAATAVRLCESMQLPGLDSARKSLEEVVKAVQLLLTPRVIGAPKKIVARRNGWGM